MLTQIATLPLPHQSSIKTLLKSRVPNIDALVSAAGRTHWANHQQDLLSASSRYVIKDILFTRFCCNSSVIIDKILSHQLEMMSAIHLQRMTLAFLLATTTGIFPKTNPHLPSVNRSSPARASKNLTHQKLICNLRQPPCCAIQLATRTPPTPKDA